MDDEKHGCCADGHWYMGHIKMSKYSKFFLNLKRNPVNELNQVEKSFIGRATQHVAVSFTNFIVYTFHNNTICSDNY